MRTAILVAAFLPFVYFAARDQIFHLRGRKVGVSENLLHLALGITLATLFTQALTGRYTYMVGALVLFAVAGAADEYIYHRHIPGEESDLHAKEHLALMIFLIVTLAVDWLPGHAGELLHRIGLG
jgi:hypothetical protein